MFRGRYDLTAAYRTSATHERATAKSRASVHEAHTLAEALHDVPTEARPYSRGRASATLERATAKLRTQVNEAHTLAEAGNSSKSLSQSAVCGGSTRYDDPVMCTVRRNSSFTSCGKKKKVKVPLLSVNFCERSHSSTKLAKAIHSASMSWVYSLPKVGRHSLSSALTISIPSL